ncbi:MAG: alkaline phosphatase family protein [Candidatus Aminicenantes bacterium]|nr:alkaline phosphatase family protein [Candidatus Aminicenantes bacterium]
MNKQETYPRTAMGEAVRRAYRSGQEDEALEPLIAVDKDGRPVGRVGEGDSLIFYDIRGEREVEITQSLVDPAFTEFQTAGDLKLHYTTLIEYAPNLRVRAAFPPERRLRNTLAEAVSRAGLRQLKISESEKAVHVGFFLNGKSDLIFPGEERTVIPSPEGVAYYDSVPEMSALGVAAAVEAAAADPNLALVMANLANVDVVGHIENRAAVIKAVESVDAALGRVVAAARGNRATLLVTADHGTVENWLYPDGKVDTGHTKSPVPFIFADFARPEIPGVSLREGGELSDVAPTVLDLLGLPKPPEMTGESLFASRGDIVPPRRKIILLILDGWGLAPDGEGNLIAAASTPHFDELADACPWTELQASGEAVGMPPGTVGNSEAGHLHIGAGRRVFLDRVRIDRAIADGSFAANPAFIEAMDRSRDSGKALHLMGIISHYSSHGTIRHLFALLETARARGLRDVFIHGFLGRRGERPESGALYVEKVEAKCRELGCGRLVTVLGRYWSLDREGNWDRVEKAYRALVFGDGGKVFAPPEL